MYTKIQISFDTNEPFKSRALEIAPTLPGWPIQPNGWVNSSTSAYGVDSAGTAYSWAIQDVAPDGSVTLHKLSGGEAMWVAMEVQQNGVPTEFPQPVAPAPAVAPTPDGTQLDSAIPAPAVKVEKAQGIEVHA